MILERYFSHQPTEDRLTTFGKGSRRFTINLESAQKRVEQPHDLLEERRLVVDAIKGGGTRPINQTWCLLIAFAKIEHGTRAREFNLQDAQSVLNRNSSLVKNQVLDVFRRCVESISYKKSAKKKTLFP